MRILARRTTEDVFIVGESFADPKARIIDLEWRFVSVPQQALSFVKFGYWNIYDGPRTAAEVLREVGLFE